MHTYSATEISDHIWDAKYRMKSRDGSALETSLAESRNRIAKAVSVHETNRDAWTMCFEDAFSSFQLIPGGRISAGAGVDGDVSLVNTFMSGPIPDHPVGIYGALAESAATLRAGGGLGCDFSAVGPRGARSADWYGVSPGSVAYMRLWDRMCTTLELAGVPGRRRGAMMATVRCDHPDIEEFISSKRATDELVKFNISVLVTADFIEAVLHTAPWPLRHRGQVYRTVAAADLWRQIMETTYEYSEPGVIFIDRMNTLNNLEYCETIVGTNSCGEVPLPHYGSCPLASINLASLVDRPFQSSARLDLGRLGELVRVGVRLLDDVLDTTGYPLEAQRAEARDKRRIGLGITGLANALMMCGATYGTDAASELMSTWLDHFRTEAYLASAELAVERGSFPLYNRDLHVAALERRDLPTHVLNEIKSKGLRNGALTAIAPTGTMSMLAGNISSGIEPVFSLTTSRRIVGEDGQPEDICLQDFAYELYSQLAGESARLPESFVTASQLTPSQHLT